MIVNLKQYEIEAALRQYIAQQGININSKTITISFTAGRKESGISAELDIEDSFTICNEELVPEPTEVQIPAGLLKREIEQAEAEPEVREAVEEVKTTSLFG
mgnify:CR=1 FL=1